MLEVQVMYLYNHNSERINIKLWSLGCSLNYSYSMVMRKAYILEDLSFGKSEARKIKA